MSTHHQRPIFLPLQFAALVFCVTGIATGATPAVVASKSSSDLAETKAPVTYEWNVKERERPLLSLPEGRLTPGFDQLLGYPIDQFSFPIFRTLSFDNEHGRYVLPALSKDAAASNAIEFESTGHDIYISTDGTKIQLTDRDTMRTIRANDGTKFTFVTYPDGHLRCARIKTANGESLDLLYTARDLLLHGVVDSSGRVLTFNYSGSQIVSLTQTWMANSEGMTRTWAVGDESARPGSGTVKYSHATGFSSKKLPFNAVVREYTPKMAVSDKMLARMFGGPDAIAGANGFEPAGLGAAYPLYRGDISGNDGQVCRGHLSSAMHLYGSADGTGESALYVPAGFTEHSNEPSPIDAVVIFYYPRLGDQSNVTLAVFHVADFHIIQEGDRVRIGNIGGRGGDSAGYRHSHIEFYRGNTGLPALSARPGLRIDPATVWSDAGK